MAAPANSVWIGWFGPTQGSSSGSGGPVFPTPVTATRFLAGDGSATAPSISFASAPTTGLYVSSGDLWVTQAGVRRVRFTGVSQLIEGSGANLTLNSVTISEGAANLLQLAQDDNLSLVRGYIQGFEQTAPAAPAANGYRIFAQDNGGKTELMVQFASGSAIQLAIEV
jgi:hypothetical protein